MREFLNIQLIDALRKKIKEIDEELTEISLNEKEFNEIEKYRELLRSKEKSELELKRLT